MASCTLQKARLKTEHRASEVLEECPNNKYFFKRWLGCIWKWILAGRTNLGNHTKKNPSALLHCSVNWGTSNSTPKIYDGEVYIYTPLSVTVSTTLFRFIWILKSFANFHKFLFQSLLLCSTSAQHTLTSVALTWFIHRVLKLNQEGVSVVPHVETSVRIIAYLQRFQVRVINAVSPLDINRRLAAASWDGDWALPKRVYWEEKV